MSDAKHFPSLRIIRFVGLCMKFLYRLCDSEQSNYTSEPFLSG